MQFAIGPNYSPVHFDGPDMESAVRANLIKLARALELGTAEGISVKSYHLEPADSQRLDPTARRLSITATGFGDLIGPGPERTAAGFVRCV